MIRIISTIRNRGQVFKQLIDLRFTQILLILLDLLQNHHLYVLLIRWHLSNWDNWLLLQQLLLKSLILIRLLMLKQLLQSGSIQSGNILGLSEGVGLEWINLLWILSNFLVLSLNIILRGDEHQLILNAHMSVISKLLFLILPSFFEIIWILVGKWFSMGLIWLPTRNLTVLNINARALQCQSLKVVELVG